MKLQKIAIWVFLAGCLAASFIWAQTANVAARSQRSGTHSGEGLFRPSESGAPAPIMDALSGVVRVTSKIQFKLTVFATEEEAAAARHKPGARDKQYLPEGGVVWPVIISRSSLHQLCADAAQAAQPGFYELCEAESKIQGALPQTTLTSTVQGSASGFVVGRLPNGNYIVATAYHVAREAIERAQRTAGVRSYRPVPAPDLVVRVSRDGKNQTSDYIPVSNVQLLANASEEDWHRGEDWALLAIPADGIPQLHVLPIAKSVPFDQRVWVVGFPTRTRRQLLPTSGYQNADDDLRISTGMIVGDAEARKVSASSDLLSTADGVSGNSGSVVLNDNGEVVGLFRNHTAKEGEIDLRIAQYKGLAQIVPVQFFEDLLGESHSGY
jgi:S1-C subfamily serine protease